MYKKIKPLMAISNDAIKDKVTNLFFSGVSHGLRLLTSATEDLKKYK